MSVLGEVAGALDAAGVSGWRREIAESLAAAMDDAPNASTAKELRLLMVELVDGSVEKRATTSDDLASKRAARREGRSASGS